MSVRWLDRTLLTSPVYLCLVLTEKDFAAAMKHLGIKGQAMMKTSHAHATTTICTSDKGARTAVVALQPGCCRGRSLEEVYGLLVHEAVHIWQEIRDLLGEDRPGREFEAYSVQTIAQRLFVSYNEQRRSGPRN